MKREDRVFSRAFGSPLKDTLNQAETEVASQDVLGEGDT